MKDGVQSRLSEACELAIAHGEGLVQVIVDKDGVPGRKDIQHQSRSALIMASALKNWSRGCFPSTTRWELVRIVMDWDSYREIDPDLIIPDRTRASMTSA